MEPNVYSAACPARVILDRVADKWTVLILGLLTTKATRFNELRRLLGGISSKVLAQVLRGLERDGFISRTAYPTVPVTVEYSITDLGASLAGMLSPLKDWAEGNILEVHAAQERFDQERAA